jgi:hypothetical protein
MKAGNSAMESKKSIMIIASTERQALLLFEKVLSHIYLNDKKMIKKGKDRPTKTRLRLVNGSVIHCLPTGDSGYGIRGFTIDELYADEAHFIKEEVWAAVTPMLATTGGTINLLSTPFGAYGYFYRCFHDKKFTSIHVNTEIVAKEREEPQKTNMLEFLKDEKMRMTKLQYQQEYLGLFVGGLQRFFPDELIEKICTLPPPISKGNSFRGENFQGIDIARMGGDDSVLATLHRINKETLLQIDLEITSKTYLTETARLVLRKDTQFNHKKIYIDTTGLGWGVFDILKENPLTKRKVIAIENVKKSLDRERGKPTDTRKKTIKEDLYNNLKNLMENNNIKLFDRPELIQSLRSIQYENEKGDLRIYGNFSHIAEALIRAAWCMKDKSLNIWIS